ncbi:MAG: ribonuclease domain-containing protein [Gordonia sp. (in: high G+C Gram-positive bacteria)]
MIVGVLAALTWFLNHHADDDARSATATALRTSASSTRAPATSGAAATTAQVPERVTRTLALIDAGRWPEAANAPGTRGGIAFRNSERRLPVTDARGKRLTYQEWDVNPKQRGRSRDAERIVTGSDGTAWYTADHYDSFVLIRGPGR